ncbi:serine/threonine-protein kinase, partial [Candidatus Sumerlaeota bacterium]|nr:serine/threonine-protein kinase [Candidatus Sumerlaeota bacterium]
MIQAVECGQCGELISGSVPEGLCPSCLVRVLEDPGREWMVLQPGTMLGSFEISGLLGEGGMGEVYRATDKKLGRAVAIKMLPEHFAGDRARLARFEREARLLASLNHENVARIHDLQELDGMSCLIMELIEGPTLAEKLEQTRLPIEETLAIFAQIALGLEAAHERGVIHRDLKPANIKITEDGKVKILDFGLGKAFETAAAPSSGGTLPLESDPALVTGEGKILGTPAYMSPEQSRGTPVDKRTDIWAFGCCLYEALSGRRPFKGETPSDLQADILKSDPDWGALPKDLPRRIRDLMWRCLQKDPRRRLRDIGEAWFEISEIQSDPSGSMHAADMAAPRRGIFQTSTLVVAVAALILGALITTLLTRRPAAIAPEPKAEVTGPLWRHVVNASLSEPLASADLPVHALSPDGSRLIHVVQQDDSTRLYARISNQLEALPVPGTRGGSQPFFSPDGEWLGFYADGKLKRVSFHGDGPFTICEVSENFRGASWGPDGRIIFSDPPALYRVELAGGSPEVLARPDDTLGESAYVWPDISAGGEAVVFTIMTTEGVDGPRIAVRSLLSGDQQILSRKGSYARFSPSGHVVFGSEGMLLAMGFDLARLEGRGPAIPIREGVLTSPYTAVTQFTFSRDGLLLYIPGSQDLDWDLPRRLVWVERDGTPEPLRAPPRDYFVPRISPDGRWVALTVGWQEDADVWLYDLESESLRRLTFEAGWDGMPVWSPDSERIAFGSSRQGPINILSKSIGSGAEAQPVVQGDYPQYPESWSHDGRTLVFAEVSFETGGDIWMLSWPEDPDEASTTQTLLNTRFDERHPMISPDGQWILYTSDESGSSEVYVQRFPELGGKTKVSTEGGRDPIWSRDGGEIFFRYQDAVMAVEVVETAPSFRVKIPVRLFQGPYMDSGGRDYDVAEDGRFLMIGESADRPAPAEMVVI